MMVGREVCCRSCLLVCLAAGGCDYIFRVDHVDYHGDASNTADSGDGALADSLLDGSSGRCKKGEPILLEPFAPSSLVCETWGSSYKDTTVTITQTGVLTITSSAAGAAVGGCISDPEFRVAFTGEGVMAKVDSIIVNGDAYNVLEIHGPPDLVIKAEQGLLSFQTAASVSLGTAVTYNSTLKYWRLRPSTNDTIVAEISTDGMLWSQLGDGYKPAVFPSTVGIELAFGTNQPGGSGVATVDELLVCP